MKFENVYWDEGSMKVDGVYPSILAVGDSWFWYPFPGGSLINHLGRLVATREHIILALGANGAEAFDYTHGKYNKMIRTALRMHGASLSAVFISGGGNDFAGVNDLRPMLRDDCSGAQDSSSCFRDGNGELTLEWLMGKISESYRSLIGQILVASRPGAKIVVHNYDYAIPNGKGIFGRKATWLRQALEDAGVPATLQADCVKTVINRLSIELEEITKIDPSRIHFVDSRGSLDASHWANELHPKPSGFRLIAMEKWNPVLVRLGLSA
ncbi:SGNH/GDSL hydrolase family protein [Telluria aromaticivorans]|uniref:SGNH/GDSL hydrolase family protein n=1 Tax=Telluria aromaticivorans TaxID=2725995 RepID=A0A7Y2P048_9BURK|nr:SGNH/GDSL hydrolase family protein [Telluria aromaticivorans]NNG23186.1 SGNH/GDSL hydrolase family protein [Telluria aromaticivorans]